MEFPGCVPNTKLAAVYYNGGTPPHLFRIRYDVTLTGLKYELDQINRQLNYRDTRRVVGFEYRCPFSDSVGSLRFSRMKLKNDDDVRTMFSVFGQHNTIGRSSWTLRWLDLLNKFRKVCTGPRTTKRSGLYWRD